MNMKTILLVCSAGMSTSLLVTKMEGAAKDAGVECKIFALPFSDAPRVLEEVDCILLGPQVRFQKAAIEKMAAGRKAGAIPVDVIDMRDYGTMNGKAVFENNMAAKEMCMGNPIVKGQYQTADNPIFEVFYLNNAHGVIADFSGNPPYEF